MAANDGKTEKATPRRRQQAREKGQIAKSQELGIFWTLVAFAVVLLGFSSYMIDSMVQFVLKSLEMAQSGVEPTHYFVIGIKELIKVLIPIFLVVLIFIVINYVIQVRFLFSLKIAKFDPKRINPVNYFKNLFSRKKAVDIIKGFLIISVLGYVSYLVINANIEKMSGMFVLTWQESLSLLYGIFTTSFLIILIVFGIMSFMDFAYQKWENEQQMKMSRQELKEEVKESEGNPEMKAKRKNIMYEMIKNDVRNKVPDADFIVTNPTHFAVAIRYKFGQDDAPVVIAKGEDQLALYIRSLAKEHKIPIVENKPLARALYFNVEENQTIPPEMYDAVIRVLDYLMQTKKIEF